MTCSLVGEIYVLNLLWDTVTLPSQDGNSLNQGHQRHIQGFDKGSNLVKFTSTLT